MTHEFNQRELVIDLSTGDFQINPITRRSPNHIAIIGPVDYGWVKYLQAFSQGEDVDKMSFPIWLLLIRQPKWI